MTDVKPELSVTEALRLAATDAPELVARLRYGTDEVTDSGRIMHDPSLWPTKAVERKGRLQYEWTVADHTTGAVLAKGRALFERWAWHRAGRAAAREYSDRRAAREAEADHG
jgi:hypothetical protein